MPVTYSPLPRTFYEPTADLVAPQLLGHLLIRDTPAGPCGGVIVEAEAYLSNDPACHAYRNRSERNRTMWGAPGHAYVYLIYGYHYCFNAICQPSGIAEAVLVRAIEPTIGLDILQRYRPVLKPTDQTNGPAKLCAALSIDRQLDGVDLCDTDGPLFIARNADAEQYRAQHGPLITTTRIGVTRAAAEPLRYYLDDSAWISKREGRTRPRLTEQAIPHAS